MVAADLDRDKPADRMLRCLSLPGLTGNEARVLAALAYHDGPGGCFPSDDLIVQESGLRYRGSVFKARQSLKEKRRLRWVHGRHVNEYEIAYGEAGEFDCPGNPDTEEIVTVRETRLSLSGKSRHEQEEHREGSNAAASDPSLRVAAKPLTNGNSEESTTNKRPAQCKAGTDCAWLLPGEKRRCPHCGRE